MNIERVAGNLKDNAVPLLLGVGGVVVLYLLLSGKEKSAELVPATGYTSYPDAVTNANVIIGEVNDHTSLEMQQLKEHQTEGTNAILDSMLAQNEFFSQGLETVLENNNANTGDIMGALRTESEVVQDLLNTNTNKLQSSIGSVASSVNATVSGLQSQISSQNSLISSLQSAVSNVANKVTNAVSNATSTPAKQAATSQGTTTTPATGSGTYTYTTKAGLNTNTSIVDALKATGADSSFNARAQIAAANGISNYTGSYEQNVALLNKMKAGELKKV